VHCGAIFTARKAGKLLAPGEVKRGY